MQKHVSDDSFSFNSWLLAFCIFFAAGSFALGSMGLWHQNGPAMVAALFLVMCGPFVAVGKKATPDAESDGWRALALMTAIAGGLIVSELSFFGPLFRSVMHVPERGGDGAAGWFMIAAMVGMGAASCRALLPQMMVRTPIQRIRIRTTHTAMRNARFPVEGLA